MRVVSRYHHHQRCIVVSAGGAWTAARQITPPIVAVPPLIRPSLARQRQVPRAAPPSVAQEPVPPALLLPLETSTHDLRPAVPSFISLLLLLLLLALEELGLRVRCFQPPWRPSSPRRGAAAVLALSGRYPCSLLLLPCDLSLLLRPGWEGSCWGSMWFLFRKKAR